MGLRSLLGWSSKKTEQKSQSAPPKTHQPPKSQGDWEAATVKKYMPEKGHGFLTRGEDTRDIIVFADTLKRSNIATLTKGQKVDVKCVRAPKGPKAVELRLST
jgi:cold shock CspA family protein